MENSDAKRSLEGSVERDRLHFLEAIDGFAVEEVETEFNEESVRSFDKELAHVKLFILGETHGVLENPNIIYTLFKKFGFRKLNLEWSKELQDSTERFLKGGELDFYAIKRSCDGRITAGHFALLRKLQTEGILDAFLCFDEMSWSESWDSRDTNMNPSQ